MRGDLLCLKTWKSKRPSAKAIYEQLLNKGIIVRYGGTWNLPHHVRVSVGTESENAAFMQELTEIVQRLNKMS